MLHRNVLIIGFTWPEPATTAAGNHMVQLLHFFLHQQCKVVFASSASETAHSLQLGTLQVQKKAIRVNDPDFDTFIKDFDPDIVLFDRFLTEEQFGWRVAENAPAALRILDTEDLHSLRHIREELYKKQKPFTTNEWLRADLTKREIASIYRCDLTLVLSTFEIGLLTGVAGISPQLLLHIPFMLPKLTDGQVKEFPSFGQRNDFICIGNGKHRPNVDALEWLKYGLWPKIGKALPGAKVLVYGAYLPKKVEAMHCVDEGFLVKGWAKDIEKAMADARVNLAPLRFGAGIKGKLVLAMQTGTPSITTRIGAEGMSDDLPFNGAIEDTEEGFANAAIKLYSDEQAWGSAQHRGKTLIDDSFDEKVLSRRLFRRIESLLGQLADHRSRNFIGAMLMHHTMASTKYLSKYIVEKNKGR